MKFEEIIKLFLILGLVYLLINCAMTENFTDSPNSYNITFKSGSDECILVRWGDLNDRSLNLLPYKKALLSYLTNDTNKQYLQEHFVKKIKSKDISDIDINESEFAATPLIIIKKSDISLKQNKLSFNTLSGFLQGNKYDNKSGTKYLCYDKRTNLFILSSKPRSPNTPGLEINDSTEKSITFTNDFVNNLELAPIIDSVNSVTFYVLASNSSKKSTNLDYHINLII